MNIYASYPVIHNEDIIFVTNNTLYKKVNKTNQIQTLLQSQNAIENLMISGNNLIFKSELDGGPDLYILNLITNQIERLTYTENARLKAIYFENEKIIYISNEHSGIRSLCKTYELNIETKEITELNYINIYGYTTNKKDIYIQKYEYGYLFWKNYQGGSKGTIYKNENILIDLPGQCIKPLFYNNRIYFIYENNDHTNICSCNEEGQDFKQHTQHETFKIQGLSLSQDKLIYMQIGEIYIYDITKDQTEKIEINLSIIKTKEYQEINAKYLTSFENNDEKLICTIRGNIFEKNLHSGNFKQISKELRYIETGWINNKIFGIKDGRNTELHIFEKDNIIKHKLDSQKIEQIEVSSNWIAYSNHKCELYIINEEGKNIFIAKSQYNIKDFEWSKDGNYLVYTLAHENNSSIALYIVSENKNYDIIKDEYHNTNPTIDPENKYIAFLSNRKMQASIAAHVFDYTLKVKENAFYVPLKEDYDMLAPWNNPKEYKEELNLEDIENKIKQIPLTVKLKSITALEDSIIGKTKKNIMTYSLKTLTEDIQQEEVQQFFITNNKQDITYLDEHNNITINSIKEKPDKKSWKNIEIKIDNFQSTITNEEEYLNIFEELTWLMEEFYWNEEQVNNFKHITQKYKEHLVKINTEDELYNFLGQIQGEMKTSHAYIFSPQKHSKKGYLGVKTNKENIIEDILISTSKNIQNPLLDINKGIKKGQKLSKIDQKTAKNSEKTLINKAKKAVSLEIINEKDEVKEYDTTTLNWTDYQRLQYENWVKNNENHIKTHNSEIGYIHIDNMSSSGFTNFFIKYLNNYNKKSIIIDARYNSGGHISTLLLEQLIKIKTGVDKSRHFGTFSIPSQTTNGKYVLLINGQTASDGEIFAENFKSMKLGLVIGERTWGGIIGIMPRYALINNLETSQPEFGTCFFNSKKEVENYGVTPDIFVTNPLNTPQIAENDLQLHKAIEIIATL